MRQPSHGHYSISAALVFISGPRLDTLRVDGEDDWGMDLYTLSTGA